MSLDTAAVIAEQAKRLLLDLGIIETWPSYEQDVASVSAALQKAREDGREYHWHGTLIGDMPCKWCLAIGQREGRIAGLQEGAGIAEHRFVPREGSFAAAYGDEIAKAIRARIATLKGTGPEVPSEGNKT